MVNNELLLYKVAATEKMEGESQLQKQWNFTWSSKFCKNDLAPLMLHATKEARKLLQPLHLAFNTFGIFVSYP